MPKIFIPKIKKNKKFKPKKKFLGGGPIRADFVLLWYS